MSEKVIELKNISKKYCFNSGKQFLVSNFLSFFKKARNKREVLALKDISFSVQKGEILGIIGENASGKTTILRIISQITVPSSGQIYVKGKVAGLLDLGAGFHPELTGRENIYLDAALYGLSKKQTHALFAEIVEFSGLNEFIDSQVKTYSQGMLVRLGFSVAVHVNPDIFLIDDSLAVGDAEFQAKCLKRIMEMNKQGATVVIVSHDLDSLSRIATRGILLKTGQIVKDDSIHKSIIRYVQAVGQKQAIACIDQEKLSIIFNSGRLVLLWDGKPITADFGGYLSLKLWDKWLMSWEANWQVIKTEKDFFLVQGQWANRISAQIQVKLENEREFECIGSINLTADQKAERAVFGFMFNDQYKHYLDADKIKPMRAAENFTTEQCQDLYRTDQKEALLVLSAADSDIPAVWANFNIDQQRGFGLIQRQEGFAANIIQTHVFLDQKQSAVCKTLIQLLDKKQLEQKLRQQQEKIRISKDSLTLKLEEKSFQLFNGTEQISKGFGLVCGFKQQNHVYNIFEGKWKITKISEAEFAVDSEFFTQQIQVRLNLILTGKELLLKMSLKNGQSLEQSQSLIWIDADLTDDYDSYFELTQENDFLPAIEFDEKVILKHNKCGFVGLSSKARQDKHFIAEADDNARIDLYNCRQELSTRRIRISSQDSASINCRMMVIEQSEEKQRFIAKQRDKFNSANLLGNDSLRIDCGQDRIRLFFGQTEITAALAGFSSGIFLNKRWYESHGVAKKIEKKDNYLLVSIQRKFPKVKESWRIELKQHSLIWNVYLDPLELNDAFEYKVGIILNPRFRQWINAYEKNRFSNDAQEIKLIDLTELNSCLLGACTDDAGCAVLFKHNSLSEFAYTPLLQYSNRSRNLQFQAKLNPGELNDQKPVFSAELDIVDPESWQKGIDEYCEQDFSIVCSETCRLTAKQQKTELYYQNKLISADCGLAVIVSAYDEFDSFQGHWQIKKQDPHTLFIKITYNNPLLVQNWYLQEKAGYISWIVELEVLEQTAIYALTINMFLPKVFRHWLSELGKGVIALNDHDQGFQAIDLIDNRSRYIVLKQTDLAAEQSAEIAFAPLADMGQWLLQIFKPANKEIIVLGVKRLLAEQAFVLEPGKHEIFKANILLSSEEKKINDFNHNCVQKKTLPLKELNKGRIKLVLDQARIRLFYDRKELTNGLCLYTAMKTKDYWFDSSQLLLQLDKTADMIRLKFKADCLIAHTQEIEYGDDNEILWRIYFELDPALIEDIAVGIMLNKEFVNWQVSEHPRKFGMFAPRSNPDVWRQVAESKNKMKVFAENSKLPEISWEAWCSVDWDNIIKDTDENHNSRVILSKTKNITVQDKKIEFKIKIKVNKDKE
ncbi:MAG: ABC transporter ATP-binding protein [Candidatus Omnitrophota bacterium]